jgi:hypothetical protein
MRAPFATTVLPRLAVVLLLGGLVASGGASAETETVLIKNHKQPDQLLKVQDGAPLAAPCCRQGPGPAPTVPK